MKGVSDVKCRIWPVETVAAGSASLQELEEGGLQVVVLRSCATREEGKAVSEAEDDVPVAGRNAGGGDGNVAGSWG